MDPTIGTTSASLRAPRERTWLLPALLDVQRAAGWISPDGLRAVAEHLRVPLGEVWGVATHYPELRLRAPGRRLVRVCTGVSCRVRGAEAILRACERRLGVRAGETDPAGGVTLEEMDCAFACGVAPVVSVDHRLHGRQAPESVEQILSAPPLPSRAAVEPVPSAAPPRPASTHGPAARHAALAAFAGPAAEPQLLVGVGTCGLAVGAAETLVALGDALAGRGLPHRVTAAGCTGLCWAAPTVVLIHAGREPGLAGSVTPDRAGALVEALARTGDLGSLALSPGVLGGQHRALLARCGLAEPVAIGPALRHGAYAALAAALQADDPERVIEEVRIAGLQGRGGAYFPTAMKWAAARAAQGQPKYVVVNGEEGEPGIFKDRHLMEGDPHLLLEGALLAAYAVGASRIILYVHGEADLAAARLAAALDEARAWGLAGAEVLGTPFSVEVEIRRGAGGFVLGEETALLESIEGRRAMPRTRPPFPVEAGLWGRPTVVDNVETLAAVPRIMARGGAWFAALGGGHGTKLFGLSGHLARPGVVEMEAGPTLRTLVEEVGGGPLAGRPLKAALVGGPSGRVVHARQFDEPLVPRGPVNPGTGGVVALGPEVAIPDVVRTVLAFNQRESCGKCTPCREGTARLLALLDGPVDGDRVAALAEAVQLASLCGLGQAAPLAVLSGLQEFPGEFAGPSGRAT